MSSDMIGPTAHPPERVILSATIRVLVVLALALAFGSGSSTRAEPVGVVPETSSVLAAVDLDAARSLARLQQQLAQGDLVAAERSLAQASSSRLLTKYVALFEARLLLARGQRLAAAAAAERGRETHAGTPVAAAFSELLGESLLAAGDEKGARAAWQVAFAATGNRDRRATLESRILESHERSGTLAQALREPGDETTVADGTALPPSILRDLQTHPSAQELLRRGDDLLGRGSSEDAIDAYDAALAAGLPAADARRARLQRGHALFSIRRYSESTVAFGALLPEPEARFWHARSLARSGRILPAIRALEAIGEARDPEYGAWAMYLAGTLLEDRGKTARAISLYEQVAKQDGSRRALDALWRVGWLAYRDGDHDRARKVFVELAARSEPLEALRPRYWAARSAEAAGATPRARAEYQELATGYPLSYYGWRATERLGRGPSIAGSGRLAAGSSQVSVDDLHRVEALLVANLRDFAQEELVPIGSRARGLEDRKSVGRLYWLAGDFHRAQRLVVDAYEESLSEGVQADNRVLWQLSWPAAYQEIVRDVFPRNAVIAPELVWAIMREESGYRPWITSSAGARGLLQIMPETGEQLAKRNGLADFDPNDLYTPEVNIQLGAAYLDELSRRFPDRLSAAIGSYNAGPRAVSSWLVGDRANRDDDVWVEDIPYKQTRSYVKRVLRSLHVYQSFYGQAALMGVSPAAPNEG